MGKTYKPRRAGKRWLESAPPYILDVLDNGGKTADRYTVLFTGDLLMSDGTCGGTLVPYLAMSDAPAHPQGVSIWSELTAYDASSFRYRRGHDRVRWLDLPDNIRAHVVARATGE